MNDKFLHLTALEMETMKVLIIDGKTYGLFVMHILNKGRETYKLPEIGYGTFYPVLKKLEREKLIKSVPQTENKKRKDYEKTK